MGPRTVSDLKLINAGRILENNRILAESRIPVGEVPGGVITMHVVVRPPQSDNGNNNIFFIQSFDTYRDERPFCKFHLAFDLIAPATQLV